MSKLILVRHGESTHNAKGLWTGHQDPLLSKKGEGHARAIGKALKGYTIHHAYTSNLRRSQKTWDIIQDTIGDDARTIPTAHHAHLNERDYGAFSGKNKWQVKDEVGDEEFQRIRRSWDYRVPEGESLKDVYERTVPYYLQEIQPLIDQDKTVIAVTHGNTNRALIKFLDGISDEGIAELEMPHEMVLIYHFKDGNVIDKEVIEASRKGLE